MDKKLFLIDGHSLIFRMYYAFLRRPMVNAKGMDVSILFGFTKYVLELVEREKPTHLAVCFDPPGKTFRHGLFPEYKGTRQATPELVIEALEPLVSICGALGIPVLMVPGFEGDDVLGSMAVRSASEGFKVYMVTPDKDFGQLISDNIYQFKPGKAGGDNEIFTPKELCEKLKINSPSQVIDMLAICGDTADNVPGVNGVGEVGAAKLIGKYGSLESIYEHLDELTPKQAEMFRAAQDHISLSKTLVTIKTDIPLDVTADDMTVKTEHDVEAARLFDYYEFTSLKKYIHLKQGVVFNPVETTKTLSWTVVSSHAICEQAKRTGKCAVLFNVDGEGAFARISNMTLCTMGPDDAILTSDGPVRDYLSVLEDASVTKIGYGLKQLCSILSAMGHELGGALSDIEVMHYLVNPEKSHKVELLSRAYLSVNIEQPEEENEPCEFSLFDAPDAFDTPVKPKDRFLEAAATYLLEAEMVRELESMGMLALYHDVEEPLIRVLSRMELAGVRVDLGSLDNFARELREETVEIEARVREMCGEPDLNVASRIQVGTMLFEHLKIDPRMKPKNTYPTDEETLMNYADENPIIYEILEYRGVKKLLNTYIEPFAGFISERDGRIHTTFNQALTATGRLSSSRPNLQNIPIRTDRGKNIRKAFVASSPDSVIVSADYSQIELRLMAHFCGDENMINAFRNGLDVHATTASKIFNVPLDQVTSDMRRTAKTANFGIMYGISAFGLAQRLRIPRVAAKKIIEDYFAGFPSIREWIDKTKENAVQNGYVQTMFGRRRYLPDINSRNATTRALAERNAVNAPIQGTAADIIKIAMNNVDARLREESMKSRMVLQIHDELVFEAPRNELDRLVEIIKTEMEHVIELSVPLTVECSYGDNWLEAH